MCRRCLSAIVEVEDKEYCNILQVQADVLSVDGQRRISTNIVRAQAHHVPKQMYAMVVPSKHLLGNNEPPVETVIFAVNMKEEDNVCISQSWQLTEGYLILPSGV